MKFKHSVKFLRKRKMLVMLPLLVLPFITMAFWALGGGKEPEKNMEKDAAGLNLQLPSSSVPDNKNEDKLSFYIEAEADSLKRAELMRNDPFYRDSMIRQLSLMEATQHLQNPAVLHSVSVASGNFGSAIDEQKIYQKINDIDRQINQPQGSVYKPTFQEKSEKKDHQFTKDVDRMQDLVEMINEKSAADPEMQQLDGTLEKILDIQHPQRVLEKLKAKSSSEHGIVFSVTATPLKNSISLFGTDADSIATSTGFYSMEGNEPHEEDNNALEAVVHTDQVLVNGAVIKLRLITDVYVNGSLIPKGSFIYGLVALNGERLEVEISSVKNGNSIFPVKLQVYDMDGLHGIYIPGAITRDVAKQSVDNATQTIGLNSLDPSISAQVAGAGIEAAKTLLSKKVKLVKVEVKAGYKVLLKDNNQQ